MAEEGKGKKKAKVTKSAGRKPSKASTGESRKSALKARPPKPGLAETSASASEDNAVNSAIEFVEPEQMETADEDDTSVIDNCDSDARVTDFIIFKLSSDDSYAVRVNNISEILRQQIITRAPRCAEHVVGVTSLRGLIIPVIDPGAILKRERVFGLKDASKIMVLKSDPPVGMMVRPELNMISSSEDGIRPNPAHLEHWRAELLEGSVELDGEFIPVLNVENIITIKATGRLNEREA